MGGRLPLAQATAVRPVPQPRGLPVLPPERARLEPHAAPRAVAHQGAEEQAVREEEAAPQPPHAVAAQKIAPAES